VGAHYFIHRWRGYGLPDSPELRRQACERLMQGGLIEKYEMDGKAALRVSAHVEVGGLDGLEE